MHFVHDAGVEETSECMRTAFDEHIRHSPSAQFGQQRCHRCPTVFDGHRQDFRRTLNLTFGSGQDDGRLIRRAQQLAILGQIPIAGEHDSRGSTWS